VIVVAIPVKDLHDAKQRLVPLLAPPERAALARAMLRDVLRAVRGAAVDEVWVVTRDRAVSALAGEHGCRVLGEDANRGHTAAVRQAQAEAARAGADVFVTIPADVPCLRAAEVDALAAAVAAPPAAAFAPSRSGLGTNGAALAPVDLLPLRFGEPSFADHLAAARRAGVAPAVVALADLGLDIDDADDLRALLARAGGTESARLLRTWGVPARLDHRRGVRASG
jgi:2-phospho-L-lactate/phosphoenolpyruvate guanylyltransferase